MGKKSKEMANEYEKMLAEYKARVAALILKGMSEHEARKAVGKSLQRLTNFMADRKLTNGGAQRGDFHNRLRNRKRK